RRRRSRRSVRDLDPGPDAASGARQRILAFASLVCAVAVFREPGARSVKEAVAECDRVEVRGTKEPLLNLLVGADTSGKRGCRIRRKCVSFDGEALTGAVEEAGGLRHVPPSHRAAFRTLPPPSSLTRRSRSAAARIASGV